MRRSWLIVGLVCIWATCVLCCTPAARTRVTTTMKNGKVTISLDNHRIRLSITKNDGSSMSNTLHVHPSEDSDDTLQLTECGTGKTCITRGTQVTTEIEVQSNTEIIKISRSTTDAAARIVDCFELAEGTEWFGGPQLRYQHWPIQNMRYESEPYLPTHQTNMAVAERYWLSSKGIYIYVDADDALFLDQNNYKDRNLCLMVKNQAPYRTRDALTLKYEIGVFSDPKLAHESVVQNHLGKPSGYPDERMIQYPVWSTWARYKVNVSTDVVSAFADEIVANEFTNSQLEIDDNWETCYGSAVFDSTKFADVSTLTASLKAKGFRVTLWIHPFVNEDCEPAYSQALANGYFVKNLQGQVRTAWWQGTEAAVIDFTNPAAVTWWVQRLNRIKTDHGIDSFKFDAGEVSWLPQVPDITGTIELSPGTFTSAYVRALAENFDNLIEARVGWLTQDLPIFVRMIDKDTTWTWNNGLPTLITTLLQMNMNGYVHVLPDMIGGNGYLNGMLNGTEYPSKEIFIRWLQTNVFMPSMQYSFVPWDYDSETVQISKQYNDLHAAIAPTIIRLMNNSVHTGAPLNPPIWWVDPTNVEAHKIKDEYLLGEEILVAPVIEEDAIKRDIYLPTGMWKDGNTERTYSGPMWLRNYPAPLSVLPYFYKL